MSFTKDYACHDAKVKTRLRSQHTNRLPQKFGFSCSSTRRSRLHHDISSHAYRILSFFSYLLPLLRIVQVTLLLFVRTGMLTQHHICMRGAIAKGSKPSRTTTATCFFSIFTTLCIIPAPHGGFQTTTLLFIVFSVEIIPPCCLSDAHMFWKKKQAIICWLLVGSRYHGQ